MKQIHETPRATIHIDDYGDVIVCAKTGNDQRKIDPVHDSVQPLGARQADAVRKAGLNPDDRIEYGKVILSKDAADIIVAAVAAEPIVITRRLRNERDNLARDYGYTMDARHEEHQDRIEDASANGIMHKASRDWDAQIAIDKQALVDFDVAHPEIIATIETERKANIEKHIWD